MPSNDGVIVTPWDTHNQTLVANVHPPGWENPKPASRYNLVVIGAGTAGLVTAAGAAGLGAKVALIEKHLLGGDCLNVGCVPSKSVIRSARVVAELRNAARFGIRTPADPEVDFAAVMERMRRLRAGIVNRALYTRRSPVSKAKLRKCHLARILLKQFVGFALLKGQRRMQ